MRKPLEQFALRMEHKLQENDHKPHWSGLTQNLLMHELTRKQASLLDAVCSNNHGQVIRFSADLANYAMMLADNAHKKMQRRQESTE